MAGTIKEAMAEARKKKEEEFWKAEAERLGGGTKTVSIEAGKPETMRVRKPSDFKQAWYQSSQFAGQPGIPTDERDIETVTQPVYRNINEIIPPADMNAPETFAGMAKRAMAAGIDPKDILTRQQNVQTHKNKLEQIRTHPDYQKWEMSVRQLVDKYGGEWDDNLRPDQNVNVLRSVLDDVRKQAFNKDASAITNKQEKPEKPEITQSKALKEISRINMELEYLNPEIPQQKPTYDALQAELAYLQKFITEDTEQPVIEQPAKPEYSPVDLEFTAIKHGITVEEVKRKLGVK